MQKVILFSLLVAGFWLQQVNSQNLLLYCGLPNCNGREHITCEFQTTDWGPACAERVSYNMLTLGTFTTTMTTYLNTFRNSLAGGKITGFPTAANMGTLTWNVTLANIARYNVRQCVSQLDGCRNTPDIDYAGETVGWSTYTAATNTRTNGDIVIDIMDYWVSQQQYSSAAAVAAYEPAATVATRSDSFAQLARDAMNIYGCAAMAMSRDGVLSTILLTCIFNTGLFNGKPIYKTGTPVSGCTTGANPSYPNLCSTSEVFNVNDPALYF